MTMNVDASIAAVIAVRPQGSHEGNEAASAAYLARVADLESRGFLDASEG